MIDALTYESMIDNICSKCKGSNNITIGILLGHPNSNFMKENVLSKINYYHNRSSESIHFFFPGYGAYWFDCYPDAIDVCKVDNVQWSFSSSKFVEFVTEIESRSNWNYSGETELLIADFSNKDINYKTIMVCWLDRMLEDKVIYSPSNFLETVFRYFRKQSGTEGLSNSLVFHSLKRTITNLIKDNIPYKLEKIYDNSKYFLTTNFSR